MTRKFHSMIAAVLATSALAAFLATVPPGHFALSDAELAATRGMSPGYGQKSNSDNVLQYLSCATQNFPPGQPGTANCSGIPIGQTATCYTCQNAGTQPAVDASSPPKQKIGLVASQNNQTCGGPLLMGECVNGGCSVGAKVPNQNCNNAVPAYTYQIIF